LSSVSIRDGLLSTW